jgi:predicted PurR-regulated permease PerM
MPRKVEISHRTIIFSVLFLLFLWFLYFMRDILLQLFVALLLAAVLNPLVTKFTYSKIPRGFAVLLAYVLVLGLIGGLIALIAPPLVSQTTNFTNSLPTYMANLGITPVISAEIGKEFLTSIGSIPGQIIRFSLSLFSNILNVLAVLVFSFYFLLSRDKLDEQLGMFFGLEKTKKIESLIQRMEKKIGHWVRGQLVLMLLVGVLNYIGLALLGVPFAIPLAILAGLLEIIPYLGPIIAAIPAVLIGFGISGFVGTGVAIMALLVQQLENYVFVPKIMGRSVGLSPIVVLIALAVGQRLAGITGMIVSIPFVITLQVLIKDYMTKGEE